MKGGDETIAKQLANLYTKCITERRIPKNMEGSKYGGIFQEREQKRHQELQTNLLGINLFTQLITTRLGDQPSGGETIWTNTGATR